MQWLAKRVKTSNLNPDELIKCEFCWGMEPRSEMKMTKRMDISGPMCIECRLYLTDINKGITNPLKSKSSVTPNIAQTPYIPPVSCGHNLIPFKLANGVIHLSGASNLSSEPKGPLPDMAAYFDTMWLNNGVVFANNGTPTKAKDAPEILYVKWPDFGLLRVDTLDFVVSWLLNGVGTKNVEIGCIGGHGRTGTCLAALLVKEGATATDAINLVHTMYCKRAVENQGQRWLVEDYETFVTTGVIPPVREVPKPAPFVYTNTWNGNKTAGLDNKAQSMVSYHHWWDE